MQLTPLDVLIIGCGNIAGYFDMVTNSCIAPVTHAGAYSRHGGYKIRACIDPNQIRRQDFAQYWGIARHASEISDLYVEVGEFDVISICSPTNLRHYHIGQALALRPKAIFCEKPLAADFSTAEKIVNDCILSGVSLVLNYSRRWDLELSKLVDDLQRRRWGALRSIVGHYNKGILNNGSHMLDILIRLVGRLKVVGTAAVQFDYSEDDPTVAVLLTDLSGVIPIYLNPTVAKDYSHFELEILCEFGSIRMQSGGMRWVYRNVSASPEFVGYRSLGEPTSVEGGYKETMSRSIQEIYDYLQHGKPMSYQHEDAIEVQRLCAQIAVQAANSKLYN